MGRLKHLYNITFILFLVITIFFVIDMQKAYLEVKDKLDELGCEAVCDNPYMVFYNVSPNIFNISDENDNLSAMGKSKS